MLKLIDDKISDLFMPYVVIANVHAAKVRKQPMEMQRSLPQNIDELVEQCNNVSNPIYLRGTCFIKLIEVLKFQNYTGRIISENNYAYFLNQSLSEFVSLDIGTINGWNDYLDTDEVLEAYIRLLLIISHEYDKKRTLNITVQEP